NDPSARMNEYQHYKDRPRIRAACEEHIAIIDAVQAGELVRASIHSYSKMAFAILILLISIGSFVKISNLNNRKGDRLTISDQYERYQGMSPEEVNKMPKYDRPNMAVLHNFEMTQDPSLKDVPVERSVRAFNEMRQQFTRKRAIEGVSWTERGPNNVGGRTRAIMFDPNDATNRKVWAASVGGGLWFNNNITSASSQWQNIDDFWANMALTTMAYDPSNTQTFYVGSGEGFFNADAIRGAGIWKSTNGGTSWAQLSSTDNSDFYYVQKVVVTSNGTVLAATHTGLFRSTNGGNTWSQVLSGGRFADIEVASNGDIYVSRGIFDTGSVFKSTNNGISFSDVTPETGGERIELAVAPSDPSTVYAVASISTDVAWFKKTTNGGNTWTDVTIPNYLEQSCSTGSQDFTRGQAWYDLILAVKPNNPNVVLVGGIDIHRSTNGGNSWTSVSYWTGGCRAFVHADQHAMAFSPGNSNTAIFGHDGGVSYSTNVGNTSSTPTFATRVNGYNVTQFYAADQVNASGSNFLLAGAQDNGSHRITTSGISSSTEVTGGDGAFCHIDQDNSNFQITSFVFNNFFRSTNGGSSFSSILSNSTFGRFINPTEYDDPANILYSAANEDQLIRISGITGSTSPALLNVNLEGFRISAIKASPYTNNRLFVGTGTNRSEGGSRVFRIDNANGTPTSVEIGTSAIPVDGYISSVEIGSSENQILVTLSNYGVASVWETRNGGTTWSNKEGNLPDIPVRWALYNPNNTDEVLLATELGVWSTDDITENNPEWGVTNTGLANVRTDMLQYRESDGQVVVTTHGRGLFVGTPFDGSTGGGDGGGDPGGISCTNTISAFPYAESFESGVGTWVQASGDDGNWVNDANGTPSSSTGPSSASNGSFYMFLEASTNGSLGQIGSNATAILESPCIDLTSLTAANFVFNYHMFGTNMGTLRVEVSEDGTSWTQIWSESGNQGNSWFSTSLPLSSYIGSTIKLRFRGTTGSSWRSDMAIDNISITGTSASTVAPEASAANPFADANLDSEVTFDVYPNPVSDYLRIDGLDFEQINYSLLSVSGKIMRTGSITSGQTIDLSALQSGHYLIKINSKEHTLMERIIKR
ncbi:MAG: T9SS type A sorting domain-containing protein, partial [Bacteroidota bacterium]